MKNKSLVALLAIPIIAISIVGSTAFAGTQSPSITELAEIDTAITGDALTKASAASLAYIGGGRVTETEVGDEESYYEVEVTLANGNQVDVQLDEKFHVVGDKVEVGSESEAGK